MNQNYGFYRVAAVCPKMKVADTGENTRNILFALSDAVGNGAKVVVLPELCLTGYTCNDLFHQETLLQHVESTLEHIVRWSDCGCETEDAVIFVGAPLRIYGRLYNCAIAIQNGNIVAVTPKIHLPNQREFYEKRYFSSGRDLLAGGVDGKPVCCTIGNFTDVPITNLITVRDSQLRIGVELCEDLWTPAPPSGELALAGANLIVNLSASDALVGKADYRRGLVSNQSARCIAGYVYASAGVHESTTDMVCSGHLIIAENGTVMAERNEFSRETEIVYADIDVARLEMQRISEGSFQDFDARSYLARSAQAETVPQVVDLKYRFVSSRPFVPALISKQSASCKEIFNIQCAGLAKRLESGPHKRAILGLSGGLDSTLALLVVYETFMMLGRPACDILAVTMPGFGTTDRTKNNAVEMANCLGVELRTIDITKACMQHFADIGHDPANTDVTYENVQARERTQILMDLANKEHGIVIGTGDLSEIALGWCTYNADHMSMYSVNCDIPKTLVRYIVSWYSKKCQPQQMVELDMVGTAKLTLSYVLQNILNTPVSPELLPADKNGQIVQKTEDILGSYDIHDFYLYHFVKYGATPAKMLYLADYAFRDYANQPGYTHEALKKALELFLRRFFTQQFKRSCIPDGPKVGTLSLSPRADWRMPSDASFENWIASMNMSELPTN